MMVMTLMIIVKNLFQLIFSLAASLLFLSSLFVPIESTLTLVFECVLNMSFVCALQRSDFAIVLTEEHCRCAGDLRRDQVHSAGNCFLPASK